MRCCLIKHKKNRVFCAACKSDIYPLCVCVSYQRGASITQLLNERRIDVSCAEYKNILMYNDTELGLLFCAGGAKQHSSERWAHQGRRSHPTGEGVTSRLMLIHLPPVNFVLVLHHYITGFQCVT